MNPCMAKAIPYVGFGIALVVLPLLGIHGQDKEGQGVATVEGTVCDSSSIPLKDATVLLERSDGGQKFVTHSDEQGKFRFVIASSGKYTVSANKLGYSPKKDGPFLVGRSEEKAIELHLIKNESTTDASTNASTVQFSDKPQFQIAGIADPTNYGGHGSDTVLRTKEGLAQDTVSLKHGGRSDSPKKPADRPSASAEESEMDRQKGDAAEREGRPLDAVREYQLAAELQPSEPNLFAWGAELLLHRAYEPAVEVFSKGQRKFPTSTRMLLGLGIATYDQGATERGEQFVLKACDLNPADPEPYLFLGRLLEAEKIEPPGWAEKLQRFVSLHPENAMAHYYYAVALSKQKRETKDARLIQSELEEALKLDGQFGKVYLQLGILYAERKNFPAAISAFQKAIETLPLPDEAHYRLAQVYRQMGEVGKERQEIKLYQETSQERAELAEAQRHEIQQFVYTLRGQKSSSSAIDSKPQ